MLSFAKNPNGLSIFVIENNVIIEEICYSNLDDLFEKLKEDYYFELMATKIEIK